MDGHQFRLRGAAIIIEGDALLLERYLDPDPEIGDHWQIPGGGVEDGESVTECVRREVHEETGLRVRTGKLLYIKQVIVNSSRKVAEGRPSVGLELCYQAEVVGGALAQGLDESWMTELRFVSKAEQIGAPLYPGGLWERIWDDRGRIDDWPIVLPVTYL